MARLFRAGANADAAACEIFEDETLDEEKKTAQLRLRFLRDTGGHDSIRAMANYYYEEGKIDDVALLMKIGADVAAATGSFTGG